jgi:osmoprotectant transport system ATP-binding protein
MIELQGATRVEGTKRIVDEISLTVASGQFCALVGPSGSGKSTTLKMINRLVPSSEGKILVGGKDITSLPVETLRRSIGYAIQSGGLFPHWSVADNIATVPRLLKWPEARVAARIAELIELSRLEPSDARKYPHQLSGGQQQRVGVARALAADPQVLLMDEPFGALDPITRVALQDELAQLHRRLGKTILFVTHDIDEALKLADVIAILDRGRLAQFGAPLDILDHPASHFVREFVGPSELGLRRLSLRRVAERMRGEPMVGDAIAADMSLRDALSRMIANHTDRLAVRGADGAIAGSIALGDLLG